MGNMALDTYAAGIGIGVIIGFLFAVTVMETIVNPDPPGTMFGLGVLLMASLFVGYVIHKEGDN